MSQRLLERARGPLRACAITCALWVAFSPSSGTALRAEEGAAARPQPSVEARTAQPLLWKLDRNPPSYLFGTIHLPDARVLDLPESVEAALEAADVVYTEIPMDVQTQIEVQQRMLLPDGATLASVLPADLNQRLETRLERYGAPMFVMRRLKVWAVATMLPLLQWYQGRPPGPALDQHLADLARAQGKQTAALETVASQIAAMESLGRDGEITMLRQTLEYLEQAEKDGDDPIERLLVVYLTGEEERLLALAEEQISAGDELGKQIDEALIQRRNRTMTEAIVERLRAEPDRAHFFAVGALHYPGPGGIVALLEARGFEVERVTAP